MFESCGRGWEGLLYNLTLFSFQQVVRFVDGLFCYDDVGGGVGCGSRLLFSLLVAV